MRSAFVFVAGVMFCLAGPLLADKKESLDGEKILADFAQCAVRAAPRETRIFIDTVPGSEDEKQQMDLLLRKQGGCIDFGPSIQSQELAAQVRLGQTTMVQALAKSTNQQRQMTFSVRAFRGAIASQLYISSSGSIPLASSLPRPVSDYDAILPVGYVVVRCAAERDPVSADRIVRSKRLSPEEADAGRALSPALNSCAHGKDKIEISGTAIHGWAAEALFKQRRSVATEGR